MPIIIRKNKRKKYYHGRSPAKSSGEGLFDNLLSTITSQVVKDAAKEVAVNVGKKAATELGNKASEKVINKIFPSQQSKLTPESRMLLNNIIARGSGTRRI